MKLPLSDFFDKIQTASEQKRAFVVFRKPNQTIINAQFQLSNKFVLKTDFKESGFVFAPFEAEKSTIFFPLSKAELFESDFFQVENSETKEGILIQNKSIDKVYHIKLIKKAIDNINSNEFKKVVISRKEEIKLVNYDLIKTYKSLLQKYPSAMVYVWFHPKVGLWMGATPELLCKVKENHFSTVALAGTQLVNENENVVWEEKEKIEQQLVTDFIVNELKDDIQNLKISTPYSVKAGHLWHIKTDIEGEISKNVTINKIIKKLHPTPAVCGLPKKSAKDFILNNEAYNREFYTGYLGEINLNTTTELFVNLRCMKIVDQDISIFVGGGITKDSSPEKEWEETVAKAKTMKNVLL